MPRLVKWAALVVIVAAGCFAIVMLGMPRARAAECLSPDQVLAEIQQTARSYGTHASWQR